MIPERLRLLFIIFLCSVSASFAGTLSPLRSISVADGLSDLVVNKFHKDARGYVWIGTGLALDRFDGTRIKSYPLPGENLNLKRVKALAEGTKGEIYVGNSAGLYVLTNMWDELEPFLEDRINIGVNSLLSDGNILYIGTDNGLFIYDSKARKLRRILINPDVMSPDNKVCAMYIADDGVLWVASSASLHRYNAGDGNFESFERPSRNTITSLEGYGPKLYVGTYGNGVETFDLDRQIFTEPVLNGNDVVTALSINRKEATMYVATDGEGIYTIKLGNSVKEETGMLRYSNGESSTLRSNSVYTVMADSLGLLWIGYYQAGADYTPLRHNFFDVYEYPGFINTANNAVRAVAIDGSRKLIGTREGLYFIDEATGRTASFHTPRIRSNIIFSIFNRGDRYFVGTYTGGMYVFDANTLQLSDFEPSEDTFRTGSIFKIEENPDGSLWVATSNGLYHFPADYVSGRGNFTRYDHSNSQLPEGNVYEVFFDSTGRGWICTENGLAIWNGKEIRADGFPQDFVNNLKIREVVEDSRHNLYFLPDRGPLYRSNLSLTKTVELSGASSLTGQTATFLAEDNHGDIWIGSEQGLVCYDGRETYRLFNTADGLPNKVFTLCTPVVGADGDLWMGNTRGLVRLDLNRLRQQPSLKSLPLITDVESNGESVYNRIHRGKSFNELKLTGKENNIIVSFANFEYLDPEDLMLEYYLEGVDDGWHIHSGGKQIQYFNLQPGNYTLRLRQAGDPMSETRLSLSVKGEVNAAIWGLAFLALILAGATVYYYRQHRHKSDELSEREIQADAERQAAEKAAEEERQRRYGATRLSDEECRRIFKRLENIMKADKPYTNPDLKSADLARMAGTSTHALSFLFNQYLNRSYYDYVNHYRVEAFKQLVEQVDTSRYTLTAMSQMCGFSSRASFFRHFKNVTGITPSDYLKQRK